MGNWGSIFTPSVMEITRDRDARDEVLMDRICAIRKNWWSPLCNDWVTYHLWKRISEERGADWDIVLWIMFSESHIGSNRAWSCDSSWNNRWWVKARRDDDQKVRRDQPIPNWWNCRLYRFDSMEDYFITKANIIGSWYKWCFTRDSKRAIVSCISYRYIGDPNKSETHWVNNVMSIAL